MSSNARGTVFAMSSLDKKENEHTTVYDLLRSQHVGFDVLRKKHLSLLLAVRKIIGVTPNCDKFLEIWPSAFTTCAPLLLLRSRRAASVPATCELPRRLRFLLFVAAGTALVGGAVSHHVHTAPWVVRVRTSARDERACSSGGLCHPESLLNGAGRSSAAVGASCALCGL